MHLMSKEIDTIITGINTNITAGAEIRRQSGSHLGLSEGSHVVHQRV